jgi:hypothetical protein
MYRVLNRNQLNYQLNRKKNEGHEFSFITDITVNY